MTASPRIAPTLVRGGIVHLNGEERTVESLGTGRHISGGPCVTVHRAPATGKPLAGVEFAVRDGHGQTLAAGRTDATGTWQSPELPPGHYILHEVRAPAGYAVVADRQVAVTNGRTTQIHRMDPHSDHRAPQHIPQTIPPAPRHTVSSHADSAAARAWTSTSWTLGDGPPSVFIEPPAPASAARSSARPTTSRVWCPGGVPVVAGGRPAGIVAVPAVGNAARR